MLWGNRTETHVLLRVSKTFINLNHESAIQHEEIAILYNKNNYLNRIKA